MASKVFHFLLMFLLAGGAWAQEGTVSVRTLQLGDGDLPESWVRVANEKEPVKLGWLSSQPTEPLRVVHDGPLKLFRYAAGEDGKMVISDVRSIALPAGATEILLLAWADGGLGKYVAIQDQFLQAGFDDWIAINTSVNPVALRVGGKDKPVRIDAGKSLIFKPDIEEGKGVEMIAMAPRDGKLKTFLSTYWPAFPGQRTMIVFYGDGEKMRAKRIGDRFVRKEERAAAP
jgi:hypothetical protein